MNEAKQQPKSALKAGALGAGSGTFLVFILHKLAIPADWRPVLLAAVPWLSVAIDNVAKPYFSNAWELHLIKKGLAELQKEKEDPSISPDEKLKLDKRMKHFREKKWDLITNRASRNKWRG